MKGRSSLAPAVGWVLISRSQVARAEQALLGDVKGVRDEVGLLAIHQAIADRLFPGTSVLHTRLRYALFVPWLMQEAAKTSPKAPSTALVKLEKQLTAKLCLAAGTHSNMTGIIGGRVHPKPASQPASFSYWTALSTWGILHRTASKAVPTREAVLRQLVSQGTAVKRAVRDEAGHDVLHAPTALAVDLPEPPADFWQSAAVCTFALTQSERRFLKDRLSRVKRPGSDELSLLARLARDPRPLQGPDFWDERIVHELADANDKEILRLAKQSSALAGIARGVYLCLVEEACAKLGLPVQGVHRQHLNALCRDLREPALELQLDKLKIKLSLSDEKLCSLLECTQRWLYKRGRPQDLAEVYSATEKVRKRERARLADTPPARQRLRRWAADEGEALAERLHFRWPNVSRLLGDLHGH